MKKKKKMSKTEFVARRLASRHTVSGYDLAGDEWKAAYRDMARTAFAAIRDWEKSGGGTVKKKRIGWVLEYPWGFAGEIHETRALARVAKGRSGGFRPDVHPAFVEVGQ